MDRSIDRELGLALQTGQTPPNTTPPIMAMETPPLISPSTSLGPESSRDSFGIGWRSPASDATGTSSKTSSPPVSSRLPPIPSPRSLTGLGLFRDYASRSTISLVKDTTEQQDGESLYSLEEAEESSVGGPTPLTGSNMSQRSLINTKRFGERMRFTKPSGELIRRRIRNVGGVVGQVKGDILDVTKSAKGVLKPNSSGLCEACGKIPFVQPAMEDAQHYHAKVGQEVVETEVIASLDRVIQNRTWCRFCKILFAALSVEENDPLRHPTVQNHIQSHLKGKSFAEWADEAHYLKRRTSSQAIWPFGHRSVIDENEDKEEAQLEAEMDDFVIDDPELEETVSIDYTAETASICTTSCGGTTRSEVAKEKVVKMLNGTMESISSRVGRIMRPLPVWIFIKAYTNTHAEAGTFVVQVQGQGRAPDASAALLTSFNLRLASSRYSMQRESGALRYGRILDSQNIDLSLCNKWLEHCEVHHGLACSQPSWSKALEKPSGVGFRVVDVDDEKIVEFAKPAECDYVTLSYVWGGYTTVQLLKSNSSQLSRPGGLSEAKAGLPQTVRDAMMVTKALSKRYIWVDSLCIVQDSDDKVAQLGQMDRIYGNSAVTIVAADGINANSGLEGVSGPSARRQEQRQVVEEVVPGIKVMVPIRHEPVLRPWETRAWTFQEKLLSKRLLIFSQGQVYFHCKHGVHMEDMTAKEAAGGPHPISWLSLPDDEVVSLKTDIHRDTNGAICIQKSSVFDQYASLIAQYTSRHLSFSNDILNAVTGLITILDGTRSQCISRDPSCGTFYGIMTEFLDLALLWQPAAGKDIRLRRRVLADHNQKPLEDKFQLPTWSWTAWEAASEGVRTYSSGIRYEQSFILVSDPLDGYRVKQVVEPINDAHERLKPLLRWYRFAAIHKAQSQPQSLPIEKTPSMWSVSGMLRRPVTHKTSNMPVIEVQGELKPVNGTGLGLASDSAQVLQDWLDAHEKPFRDSRVSIGDIPAEAIGSLDERHLIFRTSMAKFRLGNKTLRSQIIHKYSATMSLVPEQKLWIHEIEILDSRSYAVGRVVLHDATEVIQYSEYHDFVVISESQYFGNEEMVLHDDEYPLYNVMIVKWDRNKPHFATRVAVGKVFKEAWQEADPTDQLVILE